MSFRDSGFTLIEVLITAFVLGVVTVSLTGLSLVLTRSSLESERQEVAINVATEKLENLQAAFQARGFPAVEFRDISPDGAIEREETINRNNLDYDVAAFIHTIDDPANGLGQADFKTVLYKVTWTSNLGQAEHESVVKVAATAITFSPDSVLAASEPPGGGAVVAAVALYTQVQGAGDSCTPGTDTCPQYDCTPNAPAGCPDGDGDYTIDCPATGICPGSPTDPFAVCPASGKCSDVGVVPPPQLPQPGPNCPNGIQVFGNTDEVCNFGPVCRDLVDNDNDGGIDVGIGNADVQCNEAVGNVAEFGKEALFHLERVDQANCMALYAEEGTTQHQSGPCSITLACNIVGYVWKPIPGCTPVDKTNNCQEDRGCDQASWCIKPPPAGGTCTGENCCPQERGICGNGLCWECLANVQPVNQQACDLAVKNDPSRGNGDDAWCSVAVGGCECEPRTNKCVDCLDNDDCPFLTAPFCVNQKCQEVAACADGVDNDRPRDGKIDWACGEGNGCPNPDPGCDGPGDNDERDFILPPPRPACSDGIDNDNPPDGLIDFPADPGCDDGADLSEEGGPPVFDPPPNI